MSTENEDDVQTMNTDEVREIGNEAVWTLSTAKPGNGVEQLRDGNMDTFWQSDGTQPHLINMQFHRKMRIKEIAIYSDFKLDESYTPSKISIRAGTGFHDMQEIRLVSIEEPSGWISIPLAPQLKHQNTDDDNVLRAHLIQIAILSSHQNGRDTHIRQVNIYGPRRPATQGLNTELSSFTSIEFEQFACIR